LRIAEGGLRTVAITRAFIEDALARIVRIREAIEDGDLVLAHAIAGDLEADVAGALARRG
jgi:hypothetical protein